MKIPHATCTARSAGWFLAGFATSFSLSPLPTLNGRIALVLGYGAVGSRVARVLAALGMDVHVTRRKADKLGFDGTATVRSIVKHTQLTALCAEHC